LLKKLNIMNGEFQTIADKIKALWRLDEFDCEINQKYGDVEAEFLEIAESYYGSGHFTTEITQIKKMLKKFKEERDIYDDEAELDMMFPNGNDY